MECTSCKHNMSGPLKKPNHGESSEHYKRLSSFLDANVADHSKENKCSYKLLDHFWKVTQPTDNKKNECLPSHACFQLWRESNA